MADTIPALSPAISLPPKLFSSISNPKPTFDCTSAVAVALTAMINSLATGTPIEPIIVPITILQEIMYYFSAM
jgi:hypothetical protein